MVDLTQDLKAERNKTYNVKHEPKRIREIQTSWIILEWTTSRHLQRISKQILITPYSTSFLSFLTLPFGKKKRNWKILGYPKIRGLKIGSLKNHWSITILSLKMMNYFVGIRSIFRNPIKWDSTPLNHHFHPFPKFPPFRRAFPRKIAALEVTPPPTEKSFRHCRAVGWVRILTSMDRYNKNIKIIWYGYDHDHPLYLYMIYTRLYKYTII